MVSDPTILVIDDPIIVSGNIKTLFYSIGSDDDIRNMLCVYDVCVFMMCNVVGIIDSITIIDSNDSMMMIKRWGKCVGIIDINC